MSAIQGLRLWHGTDDTGSTPAVVGYGERLRIVVAVAPPHPSNVVRLRYRVNAGMERVEHCSALISQTSDKQYFSILFPLLPPGSKVAYAVVVINGGRQAPAPDDTRLPFYFEVSEHLSTAKPMSRGGGLESELFKLSPDYIARFTIFLNRGGPELIGETSEGLRLNWYPTSGTCIGPRLNAVIKPVGGDWMTVRRDGVGILDVRGTLETPDGALIYASYTGVFELGDNGYANALRAEWPEKPPTRTAPRFLTSHPAYLWLNRVQCVAVGQVLMKELIYQYDLYAI